METTLQDLKSSLARFNSNYKYSKSAFKIEYTKEQLLPILMYNYQTIVAQRNRNYIETGNEELKQALEFITNKKTKCSLLLLGLPGTGKTTILDALMRSIMFLYVKEISSGKMSVFCVKASELGNIMKHDFERFDKIKRCTVLFIDDIGFGGECEVVNDYGVKRKPIEEIIEKRYDLMLTTICTSNLTAAQIGQRYGQRIDSRIAEMFEVIAFKGQDFRRL